MNFALRLSKRILCASKSFQFTQPACLISTSQDNYSLQLTILSKTMPLIRSVGSWSELITTTAKSTKLQESTIKRQSCLTRALFTHGWEWLILLRFKMSPIKLCRSIEPLPGYFLDVPRPIFTWEWSI